MLLRNLFPESIFGRKLNPNAERRLRLSQARAEETIIRGHVDNALMFVDTWPKICHSTARSTPTFG